MIKYLKKQLTLWSLGAILFVVHKLILIKLFEISLAIELYYIFLALMNTLLGVILLLVVRKSMVLRSIVNSFARVLICGIFIYYNLDGEMEVRKSIVINFIIPYLYFLFMEKTITMNKKERELMKQEFLNLKSHKK